MLCIQDGTDLNFAEHRGCVGLGYIGKNKRSAGTLGLQMHSTLAVNGEGIPVGVPPVQYEAPDRQAERGKPPDERKTRHSESVRGRCRHRTEYWTRVPSMSVHPAGRTGSRNGRSSASSQTATCGRKMIEAISASRRSGIVPWPLVRNRPVGASCSARDPDPDCRCPRRSSCTPSDRTFGQAHTMATCSMGAVDRLT